MPPGRGKCHREILHSATIKNLLWRSGIGVLVVGLRQIRALKNHAPLVFTFTYLFCIWQRRLIWLVRLWLGYNRRTHALRRLSSLLHWVHDLSARMLEANLCDNRVTCRHGHWDPMRNVVGLLRALVGYI